VPGLGHAAFEIPTGAGPATELLSADFRDPATDPVRWRLRVTPPSDRAPVSLSWDVGAVGPGLEVYLQSLAVDESPDAAVIDMKAAAAPLAITSETVFEIVSGTAVQDSVSCAAGWSLIGIPLLSLADVLLDPAGQPLTTAAVWSWRAGAYELVTPGTALYPERGYWVYCEAAVTSATVAGFPADGAIVLGAGWHLISPVTAWVLPAARVDGLRTVWRWDTTLQTYRPVAAGSELHPGQGYWVHIDDGQTFTIPGSP
jgi:hypothetical protein